MHQKEVMTLIDVKVLACIRRCPNIQWINFVDVFGSTVIYNFNSPRC